MQASSSSSALAYGGGDSTVCDIINDALPSICTCTDEKLGANLSCAVDLLVDKFTFIGAIEPCAQPAYMGYNVLEDDLGFDCCSLPKEEKQYCCASISAGNSTKEPIPGLSIMTPLGGGGAYLELAMDGNAAQLKFNVRNQTLLPFVSK